MHIIRFLICIKIEVECRVVPAQSRFTLEGILELGRAKGIGDVEVFLETRLTVSHDLGHFRHRCRRSWIGLIKPCYCLVQLTIGLRADCISAIVEDHSCQRPQERLPRHHDPIDHNESRAVGDGARAPRRITNVTRTDRVRAVGAIGARVEQIITNISSVDTPIRTAR